MNWIFDIENPNAKLRYVIANTSYVNIAAPPKWFTRYQTRHLEMSDEIFDQTDFLFKSFNFCFCCP